MNQRYVWTWYTDRISGGLSREILLLVRIDPGSADHVCAYLYEEEDGHYWVAKIPAKIFASTSYVSIHRQLLSRTWQRLGGSVDLEELKSMVERAVIPPLERLARMKKIE